MYWLNLPVILLAQRLWDISLDHSVESWILNLEVPLFKSFNGVVMQISYFMKSHETLTRSRCRVSFR